MSVLFRAVVSHPVAVTMIFLAALVFGGVSYERLPIELMPDIAYPTITVRTGYEGAAPQEVEAQISRPVEEALATLDGLVTLESRSRAGSSDVVLGFDWGTDMSAAVQTIRENLQTTFLPKEADRPLILRYDPSLEPFLRLALSVEAPAADPHARDQALFDLRELAEDDIKRALEAMDGVAAARVRGGLEREIRVEVREDWLAARKLTLQAVRQTLGAENINVAGGSVIEGDTEYLVRTVNEYSTLGELKALRIRRADGVLVPLTDVARVLEVPKEREVISWLDGGDAVEIEIFKEADANVVEVASVVKRRLLGDPNAASPEQIEAVRAQWGDEAAAAIKAPPALRDDLPDGVRLTILDDQASFIESAVDNLRDTAILGGLLAVGVLFLFLRDFRATAIIGLAIPISLIVGFAPLYLLHISLNLMSLGGLALGIGMLVDNAVVVLESIQRYRDQGLPARESAVRGVSEVALAVTASTLTTVAVFFPITFVEGVGGELFGDLSLAVVSSLSASLVVALVLVPTLAALSLPSATLADDSALGWVRRYLQARGGDAPLGLRGLVRGLIQLVLSAPRAELSRGWAWCRVRRRRLLLLPWVGLRFAGSVLVGAMMVVGAVGFGVSARFAARAVAAVLRPLAWLLLAVAAGFQRVYGAAAHAYGARLPWLLAHPIAVLSLATSLLLLTGLATQHVGAELIPELHQGRFTVAAALPVGTPLQHTALVMRDVEARVRSVPGVETVYTAIGADRRADTSAAEGEHSARLRVTLTPGGDLARREAVAMEAVRHALSGLDGIEFELTRPALFSFRTPLEVVLFGWDLDLLQQAGDHVRDTLAALPGLRDVRSSLAKGHPEVRLHYDRDRLHRLGLDPATVAERVRDKIQGVRATEIHRGDQRIDLRVQLVEADRGGLAELRRINVNPNLLPAIPLDAVADFEDAVGPSEIRRIDQQRAVVVGANLSGFDLASTAQRIREALADDPPPAGVSWILGGQSEEMRSSMASLRFAMMLAVFLVYVIMASTFEHLLQPLVILFSVPLAAVGTVGALLLWGLPLSVVVLIGGIVLAGVVVNNAIVLVDTINRLAAEGHPEPAAAAARLRLRPILITTATTVLGLAPLSLGLGAGAEIQQPLAVAVIGGLLSSTLLTLVVIPVLAARLVRRQPPA